MKDYSFRRNLSYMAMAFYRPRLLINGFLGESSVLYGVVPLLIFVGCYEILYLLAHISQGPLLDAFPKILPVSDSQYRLYQIFFAPFVNAIDFLLFAGVVYGLSRLLRCQNVSTAKVVSFFMFTFGIFGLFAVAADLLYFVWASALLLLVHPATGLIFVGYTVEFTHKQGEIGRWKSLVICLPAVIVFLLFRLMFFK